MGKTCHYASRVIVGSVTRRRGLRRMQCRDRNHQASQIQPGYSERCQIVYRLGAKAPPLGGIGTLV